MNKRKLRIGINGFGRIGRVASRIICNRNTSELAAINSRADVESHAYLLKHDSTYGTYDKNVSVQNGKLIVDTEEVAVYNNNLPSEIPWKDVKVDLVIDSTGLFRTTEDLMGHLQSGASLVVLSAPAKDKTKTLVMGVNETTFDPSVDKIISNSSCTTNCLSTTLKVLNDAFQVKRGFMTTTHAVTDSQNLLDNSHKKEERLRRSAFASMIPASTGSAKDIGKLYPTLAGKLICQSIRIPLFTGSLINLTAEITRTTTKDDVNRAFETAEGGSLKGILEVAKEPLVSHDFIGNTHSSIIDPYLTQVLDGNLVNIYAWYDNEWGYANRLIDMAEYLSQKAGII
jgi:glyceraldehyde 3-phosphate dehydrogenase